MKIGVYVGSFNPVHKGHVKIVNHLLDNYLDRVIIMATESYWDKTNLISINDRINMLKTYQNEKIIVEEEKNDLPYTYMVMYYLKGKYKNNELSLIIGADNIVNFDKWQKYKEVLKYNLIIIGRDDIDINYYLSKLEKQDKYLIIDNLENMDISSTKVRNLVQKDKVKELKTLIDEPVLEYIVSNSLYKN